MPLIAPRARGRRATVKIELDGETRRQLKLYAKYSSNDCDRIVEGALGLLFTQDKGFAPWVALHGDDKGGGGGARPLDVDGPFMQLDLRDKTSFVSLTPPVGVSQKGES